MVQADYANHGCLVLYNEQPTDLVDFAAADIHKYMYMSVREGGRRGGGRGERERDHKVQDNIAYECRIKVTYIILYAIPVLIITKKFSFNFSLYS